MPRFGGAFLFQQRGRILWWTASRCDMTAEEVLCYCTPTSEGAREDRPASPLGGFSWAAQSISKQSPARAQGGPSGAWWPSSPTGTGALKSTPKSIRAVVGRFRQTRILPPPFYLWAMLRVSYPPGLRPGFIWLSGKPEKR